MILRYYQLLLHSYWKSLILRIRKLQEPLVYAYMYFFSTKIKIIYVV